jgi:hypothetical protein
MKSWHLIIIICILALAAGCSRSPKSKVIVDYPLDNMDNIMSNNNIVFDKEISSDGKGSLKIEASNPVTITLLNVTNLNISNTRLIYSARIRTQRVIGQVYLEMFCYRSGWPTLESRGQATLQSGTDDWKDQETSFDLLGPIKPDSIMLSLAINGTGTAWIDDIKLLSGPLPK